MKIENEIGLVLEGGGMRGVFTCGALDYMLDKEIYFPYIVGVSAGACNGMSYMSKQRGRAKFSNIDMLKKYQYIGLKYLWSQGSILNQELLYEEFPNHILPYDYDTYFDNPAIFELVTTNCLTGRAYYGREKQCKKRLMGLVKATSSLPYVCPVVEVDGIPMLDGGLTDSIPILRAREMGYKHNVVILTRNYGYRETGNDIRIPSFIYRDYPRLRVILSHRRAYYNEQLELIERLERSGEVTVIRPIKPMEVDRLERNTDRLTALYHEGYECARQVFSMMHQTAPLHTGKIGRESASFNNQ